jgi:hypothetical protein
VPGDAPLPPRAGTPFRDLRGMGSYYRQRPNATSRGFLNRNSRLSETGSHNMRAWHAV